MILKVAYDDNSENLITELKKVLIKFPLVNLEAYHEQVFKERKKAFIYASRKRDTARYRNGRKA